ncbi:MAG: peptidoglycan-binding domain-containing protein [Acidobacteriota bacterium]
MQHAQRQYSFPHLVVPFLTLALIFTLVSKVPGQRREDRQRDDTRSAFQFDLRTRVTHTGRSYIYEYTLQQVDYGPLRYQDLDHFALIFPCGEEGYRSVRSLQSGGWTVAGTGLFSTRDLDNKQVWGLKFNPGFRLTPDGNGSPRGERTFTFSFTSDCAPVPGQWTVVSGQSEDNGEIDVPCGCQGDSGQGQGDLGQNRSASVDRDIDIDSSRNQEPIDRDRDTNARKRDRDLDQDTSSNGRQIVVTKQGITIDTNTVLRLRMQTRLTSASAQIGDKFKALLTNDIKADNLAVLPAGCQVEGHVSSAQPARRGSKSGTIGITFDQLILPSGRAVPVIGELTSLDKEERRQIDQEGRVSGSSTKRSAVFIGGGAAGGAAIGAIAGGGKGAGIGAAVGAGAGVLGVLLSRGQEAVVEPGTEFGLLLTEPLRIPNAASAITSGKTNRPIFTDNDYRTIYTDTDTIYRTQVRLRELGYLRSAASGRIRPVVRRALIRYQNNSQLRPTGQVDYPTAISLGVVSANNSAEDRRNELPARPVDRVNDAVSLRQVRVLQAEAERISRGNLVVSVTVESETPGWELEHEVKQQEDILEVFLRARPPLGTVKNTREQQTLRLDIEDPKDRIKRVIVHAFDRDIKLEVRS